MGELEPTDETSKYCKIGKKSIKLLEYKYGEDYIVKLISM